MPFIVTQKCVGEIYASCVEACPVDCIYFVDKLPNGLPDAGKPFMIIDPELCIDCGACEPECPIGAIIPLADPQKAKPILRAWAKINADLTAPFNGKRAPAVRERTDPPRRRDNRLVDV